MRTICVVTTTRAEYGALRNLLINMKSDSDYDKQLLKKRLSELRSNDENNSIF